MNNNSIIDSRSYWNIVSISKNIWSHRNLIIQFTKREVIARYKGSYLGILWSFINPVLMLLIYTFVFSVVFKTKWGTTGDESKIEFALLLFCGITTFNIFAEVVTRSSSLILSNVNYVKKVVFPLEILPIVALGNALVHGAISFLILIVSTLIFMGTIHWTVICIPIVLLPLFLLTLAIGWFLSALGVFFRDMGYLINFIVQALMFLSPIFYPTTMIPVNLRIIFYLNPFTYVIEDMRRIIIWGQLPNWEFLITGIFINGIIAILGYAWFEKTRGGFADVL